MRALGLLAAIALAGCAHAGAEPGAAVPIAIERPIVVASDTVGGEVAAYAVFANSGPTAALVAAECSCANEVQLHVVGVEHGMAEAWPLPLASGARTAVEPPGRVRHFMLMGLKAPIGVGETVRLRFKLEDGRWIEADFAGVTSSSEAWQAFEAEGS